MKNETKAEKIIRQEIERWSILKPTTMAKDIMKALNEANLIFFKRNVIKSVCRCKEGKQGRTVDENWEQICDVCGGS